MDCAFSAKNKIAYVFPVKNDNNRKLPYKPILSDKNIHVRL